MHGLMAWLQRRWSRGMDTWTPRARRRAVGEMLAGATPGSEYTGQATAPHPNVLIGVVGGCRIDSSVASALARAGYGVRVAEGWPTVLQNLRDGQPSAIVLCALPDSQMFTALRSATAVPILALLVDVTETEMLDVLAAGADDCQPASIGSAEILSRVRALLRRACC